MKILFVEDTEVFIERFKPQLEELGKVTHFKGSNAARREMGNQEGELDYDLIVCDHYINRFEGEGYEAGNATGDEIYMHLRMIMDIEDTPFIHFSSAPCPNEYPASDDKHFHTLCKDYDANLIGLVKEVMGLE